jgi:hypothetical protein
MSGDIYKSERFKKDVQQYDTAIKAMPDGATKDDAKRLLSELVFEVKKMDGMYMDMVYNHQLGSVGNEFRDRISQYRRNLAEVVKRSNVKI